MAGSGNWRAWLRRSDGAPARGDALRERLRDARSGRVVFLSHCLLNEHTRYPGGACHACCVREVVERCLDAELGMVQLPCPEELAWGGVGKRALLPVYGLRHRAPGFPGCAASSSRPSCATPGIAIAASPAGSPPRSPTPARRAAPW
ncbi:MAG: hypothetical protein U0232_03195 [Thermomicrobiales bacterium]